MTADPYVPLTRGYVAIVDASDYEELSKFKWHAHFDGRGRGPYARRHVRRADGTRGTETMHRHLLPDAPQVDHINGDGLDNRRSNLRPATQAQNGRNRSGLPSNNTSGYRGVLWRKREKKWHARIVVPTTEGRGWKKSLGYFDSAEDAARAFDRAAMDLYGEFAGYLNFPTRVAS